MSKMLWGCLSCRTSLLQCCVFVQDTLPLRASLHSGINEYLVGQRLQCVLYVTAQNDRRAVYAPRVVEIVGLHEETGLCPGVI